MACGAEEGSDANGKPSRSKKAVQHVAFAPHRPIEVDKWGVDWYAFSPYKVYGPHVGALFGSAKALELVTGPNHYFIDPREVPYKFELGGCSHEACAGLVAMVSFFLLSSFLLFPLMGN